MKPSSWLLYWSFKAVSVFLITATLLIKSKNITFSFKLYLYNYSVAQRIILV